jgi:hypothetical protein
MINGMHAILYSQDADATREALRQVLGTRSVDAGGGWLIFALPPAELAVHPAGEGGRAELYLMCDDVAATVAELQAKGFQTARPVSDEGWGCSRRSPCQAASSSASTSRGTPPRCPGPDAGSASRDDRAGYRRPR